MGRGDDWAGLTRPENLRAVGVLALVAASSCWLLATVILAPDRVAWVATGALEPGRRLLLLALVGSGVALATIGGLWRVARGAEAAEGIRSSARLLAPLGFAGLLPILFARSAWHDELGVLVAAGGSGLILARVASTSLEEAGARRWFASLAPRTAIRIGWVLTILFALYYAVIVSRLTVISHLSLGTRHSDLSELHGVFYNTLHGHPFRSPAALGDLADWAFLRVHAVFIVYLLLPLYALAPHPETLLVLQSVAVALTAVPLYGFAVRRVGPALGVGFVAAFLLWPAIEQPNFFDFHFLALSPPLVMTLIAILDRLPSERARRRWPLVGGGLVALLVLLTREDLSVGLVVLGLVVALSGRSVPIGATLAGVSATYFAVVKLWLMPQFGTYWFAGLYQKLAAPGLADTTAVIVGIASNPGRVLPFVLSYQKLVYVLHLAAPLLFLWWRRPWLWLALAPGALFTLMVTDRGLWIGFQYAYFFAPYVIAASVLGAEWALDGRVRFSTAPCPAPEDAQAGREARPASPTRDEQRPRRWALFAGLVFASLIANNHLGALLGNRTIRAEFGVKHLRYTPEAQARYAQLQQLVRRLPADARVTASEYVSPHVSERLDVYRLMWGVPRTSDCVITERRLLPQERTPLLSAVREQRLSLVAQNEGFLLFTREGPPADVATVARLVVVVEAFQR